MRFSYTGREQRQPYACLVPPRPRFAVLLWLTGTPSTSQRARLPHKDTADPCRLSTESQETKNHQSPSR